jgi:hypothetical protein
MNPLLSASSGRGWRLGLVSAGLLLGASLLVVHGIWMRGASGAAEAASPAALDLKESFDKTAPGQLPTGWSRWSNTRDVSFAVSAAKPLSGANGLASSGGSRVAARAWLDKPRPADVQAGAAVLLDTLIPVQVLVRGTHLDTASPSYYAVSLTRGLEVQIVRVLNGTSTTLGRGKSTRYFSGKWVRATLDAQGKNLRAQVFRPDTSQYLNDAGEWQADPAWAVTVADTTISQRGQVGLARVASYAGAVSFDDFSVAKAVGGDAVATVTRPGPKPISPKPGVPTGTKPPVASPDPVDVALPAIPRHYPHIRIALLAYGGNPMGAFEDQLLKESVDLVVPHTAYLKHIQDIAPGTPQLIYSNASNLYLDLLLDWLQYADQKGISREAAFYHAATPKPFRGDSASSRPVTWFWGVYRSGAGLTDMTGAAHGKNGRLAFGRAGESLYVGHCDPFREINVSLLSGAGGGWAAMLEYPSAVDANGRPAAWTRLKTLGDTTSRLTQSGEITFDPPSDWKPALIGGSDRLFYVRFHTSAGGFPPVANNILGRDYVEAKGTNAGTVPVFDTAADLNQDGYLDDTEYARRAAGKNARFLHESRLPTAAYGQMRFYTNPSNAGFRDWAVDYHLRFLKRHPLATGLFMDNSEGKLRLAQADALETVAPYPDDYGLMLSTISKAIAPRWILANTGGGGLFAHRVIRQNPAYLEEFLLRPLSHHWGFFEESAALVAQRSKLTRPAPFAILDTYPQNGSVTDPRMQLATLAYYYLLADPESTFLMFYGGYEPGTAWTRHWCPAAAYNIGQPVDKWTPFAMGADPSNPVLNYRVYQRSFEKALVLYKPLSYARGQTTGKLGDETATRHDLKGTYRPLRADGTLGEPVTSIALRNGEGAILVKSLP